MVDKPPKKNHRRFGRLVVSTIAFQAALLTLRDCTLPLWELVTWNFESNMCFCTGKMVERV